MKFTIQREHLLKPLLTACSVVEKRQTLPILANVLLDTENGNLTLVATDLEIEVRIGVESASTEAGRTTVSARKFADICRTLPEGAELNVVLDNERVFVRSGRSRFTLATLAAAEFPATEELPTAVRFSIAQGILKDLIERTHFAMALQDVRYYLNGLLLELGDGRIRGVATDGHRLALYEAANEQQISEPQQVIVPRKAVMELGRLLDSTADPVEVEVGGDHLRVTKDKTTFTSKLIDGRFPEYQRVLPEGGDKRMIVDKEVLRQALARASILSNEKFRSVRFVLAPGSLRLLANNPEQEEAEEEVPIEYDGGKLEVGFNVNYFLDALSGITEERASILFSDPDSCCLIQGVDSEHCKYVVMPMRL